MFYQGISLGKIIKKLPKDMLMIFAFLITIYLTAKELKNAERCGGDKMWYEDVVCQLNKEQVYTRQQYDHFRTTVSEGVSEVEVPETEYVTCGVCDGMPKEEYD